MDAREVGQIAANVFDAKKYELRTHVFAQVTGYDDTQNLVQVQPVRKAIRMTDAENPQTIDLPLLTEVLVRQYGSGKLWCTVAPAVGSYGYLHISDRDIDNWLATGGIVEPTDVRCMSLRDAVFEPSLLHLADEGDNGLIAEPVKLDRISLRTRSGLTEISVIDGEEIEINVNDGVANLAIDTSGNVVLNCDGTADITSGGTCTINGNLTVDP